MKLAFLCVSLASVSSLLALPALADEPRAAGSADATSAAPDEAVVQEAGQRYDRGLKMYAEGDYALAVIEFERAYELVPDYRVLYNIGQVRIQLAHYARARRALAQYLEEGADRVPEERKKAVESDLEMLAQRTSSLNISVNVPGAEIFVDDVLVGQSPLSEPLLVDAGERRLSARKPGYHARAAQVTLAGRDSLNVTLTLEKQATGTERIIVERVQEDSSRNAWMWGTWAAAGVFGIASGVTGGLGIKAANDHKDKLEEPGCSYSGQTSCVTSSELSSSSRRARTLLLAADIFGGLAIASGGIALYLTLSGGSDEEAKKPEPGKAAKPPERRVGLAISPGFVSLKGTY